MMPRNFWKSIILQFWNTKCFFRLHHNKTHVRACHTNCATFWNTNTTLNYTARTATRQMHILTHRRLQIRHGNSPRFQKKSVFGKKIADIRPAIKRLRWARRGRFLRWVGINGNDGLTVEHLCPRAADRTPFAFRTRTKIHEWQSMAAMDVYKNANVRRAYYWNL